MIKRIIIMYRILSLLMFIMVCVALSIYQSVIPDLGGDPRNGGLHMFIVPIIVWPVLLLSSIGKYFTIMPLKKYQKITLVSTVWSNLIALPLLMPDLKGAMWIGAWLCTIHLGILAVEFWDAVLGFQFEFWITLIVVEFVFFDLITKKHHVIHLKTGEHDASKRDHRQ